MSLILKIVNEQESNHKNNNFNLMIKKNNKHLIDRIINDTKSNFKEISSLRLYVSVDPRQKNVVNKLLSNHLIPDISNITQEYLIPMTFWIEKKNFSQYFKDEDEAYLVQDLDFIQISLIDNKKNGIIKGFLLSNPEDNSEDLGTEIYKGNTYKVKYLAYYLNDKLSRTDGPAVLKIRGKSFDELYYLNGMRHRQNQVAMKFANGQKEWYLNGKKHRDDGPAIEASIGQKEWWIQGKLHRTDGPALERLNGYKEWYLYGIHHRENGPAIEAPSGQKEWRLFGKEHRIGGPSTEFVDNEGKFSYGLYRINGIGFPDEKTYNKAVRKLLKSQST